MVPSNGVRSGSTTPDKLRKLLLQERSRFTPHENRWDATNELQLRKLADNRDGGPLAGLPRHSRSLRPRYA